MPSIKPFRGVVYNKSKIGDIAAVLAPPYDIIPEKMQEDLYRRDPFNFVRLELGKVKKTDSISDNRYTRSRALFESWLKNDVMVRDERDAIYIYSQEYKDGGRPLKRVGFLGLMEFGGGSSDEVLPHENTLKAPKEDRLALMREVKANLSPIFVLFDDPSRTITPFLKRRISRHKPFIDIDWDGERHKVWRLDDPAGIKKVVGCMRKAKLFIADGHHRFETAKNFARELASSDAPQSLKDASRSLMVYFVESDEKMLTVLPAHRLVKDVGSLSGAAIKDRLSALFFIEEAGTLPAMMKRLSALSGKYAFGMYLGKGRYYLLRLKDPGQSDRVIKNKPLEWKRLDVSILHLFIFQHVLGIRDTDDNIEFVKDPKETAALVDKGAFPAAFFLNPTRPSQVKKIAKLGERMPRKATYFYPKQLSGLVVNKF